ARPLTRFCSAIPIAQPRRHWACGGNIPTDLVPRYRMGGQPAYGFFLGRKNRQVQSAPGTEFLHEPIESQLMVRFKIWAVSGHCRSEETSRVENRRFVAPATS